MTTHVEKALRESPKSKSVADDMLSPVSKLELARKYAAEEQQRRVETACNRMVEIKKAQLVKKLETESHVEDDGDDVMRRGGRLSSIAMRLVGAFKATTDDAKDPAEDETSSPTRKLLQATRTKLSALASKTDGDAEADLPATNYHLKQLGLADDKINIYAPVHEQQSEIRRRRESAIRCQERYMHENAEYAVDDGYKSAEDSDFAPDGEEDEEEDDEVGSDEDEDDEVGSDEDEDDDSDVEIDEDEVRGLLADQSEFARSLATLKSHAKRSKKLRKTSGILPTAPLSIAIAVVVALLAVALAVFFAEQQSGFCRALVAQVPRAEEARIVTCSVVLQVEAFFHRIVRALSFQS